MYFFCYGGKNQCKELIRRIQNDDMIYTSDIYEADIIFCERDHLETKKKVAKMHGLPDKHWIGFQLDEKGHKIKLVSTKKSNEDFVSYNEMPKRKPDEEIPLHDEPKEKKQKTRANVMDFDQDDKENKQMYEKQTNKQRNTIQSMNTTSNTNQNTRENLTKVSKVFPELSESLLHQALSTPDIRDMVFGALKSKESMGLATTNKTLSRTVPAGIDRLDVKNLDSLLKMIRTGETFDKLKTIEVLNNHTKEMKLNIVLTKSQFPELRSLSLDGFPSNGYLEIQSEKFRKFEINKCNSQSLQLPPSLVVLKIQQMNDCTALPQLLDSLPLLETLEVTGSRRNSYNLKLDVRSNRYLKNIRIKMLVFSEDIPVELYSLQNIEILEGLGVNFTVEKQAQNSSAQFIQLYSMRNIPFFLEKTHFPQLNLFSFGIDKEYYDDESDNEDVTRSLQIARRIFHESTNRDQDKLAPFIPDPDFLYEMDDMIHIFYCSSCFCIKELEFITKTHLEDVFLYKTSDIHEFKIYRPKKNWVLNPKCHLIKNMVIKYCDNIIIDLLKNVETISSLIMDLIPNWKEWNEHIMPSLPMITNSLTVSYVNMEEKEEEEDEEEKEKEITQIKLFRQPSLQFVYVYCGRNSNSLKVSLQLGESKELKRVRLCMDMKKFEVYVEEAPKLEKIYVHKDTKSFKVLNGPKQKNHISISRTLTSAY